MKFYPFFIISVLIFQVINLYFEIGGATTHRLINYLCVGLIWGAILTHCIEKIEYERWE